ncbi:MAG: hypothetical protein ACOCU2_02420 [Bacillota bacterium]
MRKTPCIIINVMVLGWFFLDMIGISIQGKPLVEQAYKDDGLFFLIYLGVFIVYLVNPKYGVYLLIGWLLMWFVSQFFSHWVYTIMDAGDEKIDYFSGTIKLIESTNRYIPDLYHIVLHVLLLAGLYCTIRYQVQSKTT